MGYGYRNVVFLLISILACSCSSGNFGDMEGQINKNINDVSTAEWQQLSGEKIFWGHNSVGFNILGGMQELLLANSQIPLRISAVKEPYKLAAGVLSHSRVGRNGDPSSKIKDFVRMVDEGIGNQADYAFFKFCYIDFNSSSDVKKIFLAYKTAMQGLKERYPQTQFIHATIPLVKVQTGPKAWVKKIIGRTLDGTKDNVKRHEFNKMLRAEYGAKDPIFDIARYESTRPDGSRETFKMNEKEYFALVPAYTSDGGHLNKMGSKYLASELLFLFAGIADSK